MNDVTGRRRRGGGDRGSATVLGAVLITALLVLFAAGVQLGTVVIARHQAQSAADLAALGAATVAVSGPGAACRAAQRVAERMGVELTGCQLRGWDAEVSVAARPQGLAGRFGAVRAAARAGPVRPLTSPS